MTLGTCLPGRYTLEYSVKGLTSGLSSSALIQIYVEIKTSYLLSFTFKPQGVNLTDPTAVQSFATGLPNNSTSSSLLAKTTAPLFGINSSSIRQVSVNWTSMDILSLPNGTLIYVVCINMTVVAGSIPPVTLPVPLQAALDAKASGIIPSRRLLQGVTPSRSTQPSPHLDLSLMRHDQTHDRALESLSIMFESLEALRDQETLSRRRSLLSSEPCLGATHPTVPNTSSYSDIISASLPTLSCSSSVVSVDSLTQAYLLGAFSDTTASLVSLQGLFQSMQDVVRPSIS